MDPYYDDSFLEDLAEFQIPESEVNTATHNFSGETRLENSKYCNVYKGSLPSRPRLAAIKWHKNESYGDIRFLTQCKFHSKCSHENIIPFIGFCKAGDKKIVVTDYAKNGSLDHHLKESGKRRALTWAKRLEICLGVAKGIKYVHELCLEDDIIVVLRSLGSKYILLDENMQPKIYFFDNSVLVPRKQQPHLPPYIVASDQYLDPVYAETLLISPEADVYSFGVVLFELMSGMLAYDENFIEDVEPQYLIHLVRQYYDAGLKKLIDPNIRGQIDRRSFYSFRELAYKCISLNIMERPTIDFIIKTLEEVLDTQRRHDAVLEDLAEFRIPEWEVNSATNHFSRKTRLESFKYCNVYKGILFRHLPRMAAIKWHNNKSYGKVRFRTQCKFHFKCSHENIIPFIGFGKYGNKRIVVTDCASNGSLDRHLKDSYKRRALTWAKRLEICLGVAKGLKYLQDHLDEGMIVLRSLCSKYILLDENMQPKICCLGDSILVPREQQQAYSPIPEYLNPVYLDPVYAESLFISPEADVYSFGVVLFELMSGMLAYDKKRIAGAEPQSLIHLVRQYYYDGLEILIDPLKIDQTDHIFFYSFGELAYKCISVNIKERPTIDLIIKTLEAILTDLAEFQIPELEVNSATNDFSRETRLENYKYCNVYKGSLPSRPRLAAIKWHNNKSYGKVRFRTQCMFHSKCSHENIIPFIGLCDDGKKMIVVTDYASNGSLDHHLKDPDKRRALTWAKRLEICLGVAKGLKYLHELCLEEDKILVLRSLCSKYILLDENMQPKICFLDNSVLVPRKHQQAHSPPYTFASDEYLDPVYLDPVYAESLLVSPEADMYSFGVVLFELMSGMLAYDTNIIEDVMPQYLIHRVRRFYDAGLEKLIDPNIRDQIDRRSFYTFGELAYKCISLNINERPTIDFIIKTLEDVLETQIAADTGVYTVARGTNYYMDPIYRESGKLRTASDVYSFGVVLFEMLTGKLAPIPIEFEDGKSHLLIHLVRRYKTGGIPDKLIDPCIKDEMDDHSLFTFQDIAYECISLNYKKRPTMDMVVDRIEVALEYQVNRR